MIVKSQISALPGLSTHTHEHDVHRPRCRKELARLVDDSAETCDLRTKAHHVGFSKLLAVIAVLESVEERVQVLVLRTGGGSQSASARRARTLRTSLMSHRAKLLRVKLNSPCLLSTQHQRVRSKDQLPWVDRSRCVCHDHLYEAFSLHRV